MKASRTGIELTLSFTSLTLLAYSPKAMEKQEQLAQVMSEESVVSVQWQLKAKSTGNWQSLTMSRQWW